MAIPEGFTRAMLGLPEEDNRRTVERPTTGVWHILVGMTSKPKAATVFDSQVEQRTTIYMDGYFADGPHQSMRLFGSLNILEAPDEAIAALKWAGYEFTDQRKPA